VTSSFREAAAVVESELICPSCTADNKCAAAPTVELNARDWTAFCNACSYSAPAARFIPPGALSKSERMIR